MKADSAYNVVGTRKNGKRVLISTHATREMADKVVGLLQVGSEFREIHVESDGKPLRRKRA